MKRPRAVVVIGILVAIALVYWFTGRNAGLRLSEGNGNGLLNTNVKGASKTNEELKAVLNRIHKCLAATNMSSYFAVNGYYSIAERNARQVLKLLRKFVPRFENHYSVPCWNISFKATRDSSSWRSIRGSIDGTQFTFNENKDRLKSVLDHVYWDTGKQKGIGKKQVKRSVACFPKIFLMGFPKCGSTFLYCLLRTILSLSFNLMDICQAIKEPHWWVTRELKVKSISPGYLALYLLNFNKGAKLVEKSLPAVTIDASPNLMFQSPRYSESETMENYCLIPSLVPVVLPDSKYFVVMRNPVSMMYSAFWFSCTRLRLDMLSVKYKGPDLFHERVTKKIGIFNDCRSRGEPLDKCVDVVAENIYDPELPTCGRTRLEMGLYYVHARRWLSVLPRDRIHFFTLEELATQDLRQTGKVILDFLEIPSTDKVLHKFEHIDCNENQQKKVDYKHDPRLKMRDDTRQILEKFFQPFNQMLADLLGDDKFLWNY